MQRTGRSPLFWHLRRAFQAAQRANRKLEGGGTAAGPRAGVTRRQFVQTLGAGMGAAMLGVYGRSARSALPAGPKVAVVGAGIAGLNATYLLAQAGFQVTLYEGSKHVGGRIQTAIGTVAANVTTELGGEFIDTAHEDMLSLADLFGLELIDTLGPSEAGLEVAYYGGGRLRSEDEVIQAFMPLARIVERDYNKTSDDITFDSFSAFDARLDHTDLESYFNKNVKTRWLYEMLEAAYVNEYGLELADQSSLNFVWTIGTDTTDGFAIYGESDQRYKIRGGNQQVVDALGAAVQNSLVFEHKLKLLRKVASGYQLMFDRPNGGSKTYSADIVVLCIPFTVLRQIELQVPLPMVKRKAIQELGYGTNAKLILGFQERVWRGAGFTGDSYAGGLAYQSGWDASRQQGGTLGAYTIFPGGTDGTDLAGGSARDQAQRLLPGLEKVFPGVKKKWLGTALRAYWPANPYVLGSYACYMPGQYTEIRGAEGMPVGNLYFAGEHTSLDFQGYMNGGAESGRVAAEAIIG